MIIHISKSLEDAKDEQIYFNKDAIDLIPISAEHMCLSFPLLASACWEWGGAGTVHWNIEAYWEHAADSA